MSKSVAQCLKDISYKLGLIADYVVETGEIGNWTYQKLNSGIAKCWCRKDFGNVAMTGVSGNVYYKFLGGVDFPFTFTETPTIDVAPESDGAYAVSAALRGGSGSTSSYITPSGLASGCLLVTSGSSATKRVHVHLTVKGRWK